MADNDIPVAIIDSPESSKESSESSDDEPFLDALADRAKAPSMLPPEPPTAQCKNYVQVFYALNDPIDSNYNKYLSWVTVEDGHMVKIELHYYPKYD
jgi:hypothetical protein